MNKNIKTTLSFLIIFLVASFYSLSQPSFVSAGGSCSSVGQCINDTHCTAEDVANGQGPSGGPCGGSELIGGIEPPDALAGTVSTGGVGINGVVFFISRLINFGAIIAGIIVIGNFIMAGIMYISGGSTGDTGTHVKVRDKLTYSVIGLAIIVSAYTVIGLISLIFFKDPLYLLNPSLRGL